MSSTEIQSPEKNVQSESNKEATLPPTVGVRRRHTARRSKRRSGRVADLGPLITSPINSDDRNSNQPQQGAELDFPDHIDTEVFQHSTPEHVPPKKNNQQHPTRKQAQQQLRNKAEPAGRKPERGRKPDRAPLKKPWENPKPRTRSKSRDRSATRSKTAPPSQGNKLNTSLGFNDTFDFDCEEEVHVTPFKAKPEDNQTATPVSEEPLQKDPAETDASPAVSRQSETISSSSSSPSSESEDSLYVPQKTRQRHVSPSKSRRITTRRGRPSKVTRQNENVPPKPEKVSGEFSGSSTSCLICYYRPYYSTNGCTKHFLSLFFSL